METEELTKLVDGIYKNILDKFNPGARQMINAGKAYLKALHGAAAASRLYVEAITKLARQAQQGTWGGSSDIGSALMQVVEVYKEIQAQQMNILKAFYVDLLVPLETNLEKDTKVVQSEQKKFLQQHKARSETYSKAAANMKKYRKKGNKNGAKLGLATDKELKNMQILEEEKSKLDTFCEQSLKNAMTQERRRYGFVLERQCSLAKHYLAYHTAGVSTYGKCLDEWQDVVRTREYLPESVENMFAMKMRQLSIWQDEDDFSNKNAETMEEDGISIASQLRKTKSMDASCLDLRSINDVGSIKPLSRAKSEFNLNSSTNSLHQDESTPEQRPKSMALPDEKTRWGEASLARAIYAYLSSGDNQLSFLEGDVIVLLGDRNKGWQFGENLRTQCSGWFPLAYTEVIVEDPTLCSKSANIRNGDANNTATTLTLNRNSDHTTKPSPATMFGDTILHRKNAKQNVVKTPIVTSLGPPPSLPAPTPEFHEVVPRSIKTTAVVHPPQAILTPRGDATAVAAKRATNGLAPPMPPMPPLPLHLSNKRANEVPGSLHSSNDSGFSNDPPPQPEVDYSDDDSSRAQLTSLSDVALNAPAESKKKELLSSVRGWLLYKSALDLWDDVSIQNGLKNNTENRSRTTKKTDSNGGKDNGKDNGNDGGSNVRRTLDNSTGTLGRFGSGEMLKATPIAVEKSPQMNNRITVKRTKSLWKFKRSYKNDILEGMSLWKHRSLIDVRKPDTKDLKSSESKGLSDGKSENIYASAENIMSDRQKCLEKVKNEKNSRRRNQSKSESRDNYYSDNGTLLDDDSDSVIVVDDHISMTMKRKNRSRYERSNRSDVSQSDTIVGNGNRTEMSNSRSDLSEQTEPETIGKESFLPRMKLIKATSNEISNRYIEREISNRKAYQTWNPNLKEKETKKWRNESEVKSNENNAIFYGERSNNKLKDAPKLIKDHLRVKEIKTKCGPWYDLWEVESPMQG